MRESSERIDTSAIDEFLSELHGAVICDLEPLRGGFWSLSYAYRVSDRELKGAGTDQ